MELDRRTLVLGGSALALPATALAQDPYTWGWVILKLAEGAVSYVGGQVLASLLGQPSNSQIVSAIRDAVVEIKQYVHVEVRQAIQEDRIRELQARAEAVQTNLLRYASILPDDRKKYRHLLETADTDTSYGAALAQQYRVMALPCYASFISQRLITMRAFYEVDRRRSPLLAYAKELRKSAQWMRAECQGYIESLSPDRRLTPLMCHEYVSEGGGFGFRQYICDFKEDGIQTEANRSLGFSPQGNKDAEIKAKGDQLRASRAGALLAVQTSTKERLQVPLVRVAEQWDNAATALERV